MRWCSPRHEPRSPCGPRDPARSAASGAAQRSARHSSSARPVPHVASHNAMSARGTHKQHELTTNDDEEWTWPTPPPQATTAASLSADEAVASLSAPPASAASIHRAQVGALLHALHREADCMDAQGVARWHPAHAAARAALVEARGQMRRMLRPPPPLPQAPSSPAMHTDTQLADTAAAQAGTADDNAGLTAPATAASLSPLVRLPHAPLLLAALLRLAVHPSAAVRLVVVSMLHEWLTSLLQAHSSSCAVTPPPFLVDVLAELGQASAARSHDFDAAVAAAWGALGALCGPAALLPVQQPAHTWTARMHAAWKAEEEAQRRALEQQAAAAAAAARSRDRQRLSSRHPKEASKRTSVSPTRSPKAAQRRPRFLSSEAPTTPSLSAEPAPTALSPDRRTSVESASSGGGAGGAASAESESSSDDADADAEGEGDEESEDDEEGDEGVLDEESDEEGDDADESDDADNETSNFRLKDGNRRLQERDDSSDDDEDEDDEDEGASIVADAEQNAEEEVQEPHPQPENETLSSSPVLQAQHESPASTSAVVAAPLSPQSAGRSSSSSPSQADSDATRALSDDDADADAEGLDDASEEEEEEEDAMRGADGLGIAAAPVVRAPPSLALTPAQELASTSAYHEWMQRPLAASFTQHQFQQCLHHLTHLVATHPDEKPMDQSWMSFVLLTTHARGTEASETRAATAAATATAVPSSSGYINGAPLTSLLTSSFHLSSFALLTSCAKYLIKHHLRSNFGAALPTLAHLDRVLTSNIKARPLLDSSEVQGHNNPQQPERQRTFASRLPLQRVLLFMDAFEKFIHHSASGCAALPSSLVDSKARDFFAANLHSCTTFFARIRAKLVQASVVADMPAATVYHAQLQLQPLLHSLAHMWSDAPRSTLAATASPPQPLAQSLQHADLLNHRQLLETVADLSQAYVRLGNPGALTSLSNLLRSKLLLLSPSNPSGVVYSRPISFFSLCFFLPGAMLQSVGRTEHAIEAYKRAMAEASMGWGGEPHPNNEPLLLANSIALQACIRGLAACHAYPTDSLASDMAWTESISGRWEWLLHTLKQTCPAVLQPLLPAVHTVQEVCRWPLQVASHQSAGLLDQLAMRPEGMMVSFEERAQLEASTARLRHSIRATIGSMHSDEPTTIAPFYPLSSEQQSALSDDLLLLATNQRLLDATGAAVPSSIAAAEDALAADVEGVHLSAAYALTTWQESAALSTALVQHRLPDLAMLPPSASSNGGPQSLAVLSTLASLELPDAARTMLHTQCAAAVAQADSEIAAAALCATPLCTVPLLSLMDVSSLSKLRRAQLSLRHASPSSPSPLPPAGTPSSLGSSSLLMAQHALHGGNTLLASSLLQGLIATVPASAPLAQRAWVLATIANVTNGYGGAAPMHQLLQIVGLDPFAIVKPVTGTLLPFAFTLASVAPVPSATSSPVSRLAFSYLVELVRSPSLSPSLSLPPEHVAERAVTMLREALEREGASPHLWQQHAHLFYMRALQLTCVPALYAHVFLRDAAASAAAAAAAAAAMAEEKTTGNVPPGFAPLKSKRKTRLGAPLEAQLAHQVDGSEEANRGEADEDYAQLRSLVHGILGLEGPAAAAATMATLSAMVFAINAAIEAATDEANGLALVRSTSLTRPAPLLPPVPESFPPAVAVWVPRLHAPLWSALCKALPHYQNSMQIEYLFAAMFDQTCMRAARVVAYAESALFALVQAQQLLSCSSSSATYAASHPARSRVELPLTLLTLLTRFGGELPAVPMVSSVLFLPPRTFLCIFPQLFARSSHAHPLVRSLLQALVCSIGEQYPHQVVFPLCVAMHEEEEWRRDEQRCAAIEAAQIAGDGASLPTPPGLVAGVVTPRHQMLLRMVHAIDRRTVSDICSLHQQQQQAASGVAPLHMQLLELFCPRSFDAPAPLSSGSRPSSPSSFLPLLSSVHRLVLELNRIAFLWEDSYLWEFRRLQSELEVQPGVGGGGFAGAGSRGKMMLEELELIMHQFQYRVSHAPTHAKGVAALGVQRQQHERAPDPAMLQLLRSRYSAILSPLLFQLLELHRSTLTVPAATPHELHFQRKYSRAIGALLDVLQRPSDELLLRPSTIWPAINAKIAELRRQMSRLTHLHIKDVSPLLAKWQAVSAPRHMPTKTRTAHHSRAAHSLTGAGGRAAALDPASAYPWWTSHAVPTTQSPQIFLAGMQGTEDLYENAHPNPAVPSSESEGGAWPAGTYLQSFDVHIELLRTKTRPKKLSFGGSDGGSYTYLLKSREDLHLDARMMQLLQNANRTMYESYISCHRTDPTVPCMLSRAGLPGAAEEHVCHTHSTPLYARTFAVIPLSDKSGLLRWIDGVTPIFDLYKLDQTRRKDREERAKTAAAAAAAAKLTRSVAEGKTAPPLAQQQPGGGAPPVPKSTDLFAQKLLYHLQAAGLSKSTPRKDIPLHVLVRVLNEMEADSRDSVDVLQRELWLSSATAVELYSKTLLFTRSLACMSMLGYILGLGDRHLGNMMVSLARGDVLHIDWNISLDRGLKLPIPEVVPFRLTPVLTRVGGVAAGAGTGGPGANFSRAATAVMHCMRQREHHFASLLSHALVFHPLSEWKPLPSKPFLHLRKNSDMRLHVGLLQSWLQGVLAQGAVAGGRVWGSGGPSVATVAASTSLRRLHELQRLCGIKGQGQGGGHATLESGEQCMLEFQQLQLLLQQAADPTMHLSALSNPAALASFHAALTSFLALQRSMAAVGPPTREEKNKHAFHAVKRIQQKLCGIETVWHHAPSAASAMPGGALSPTAAAGMLGSPQHAAAAAGPIVPLSVSAQVELLIAEATNKENLARLYEGWAPWI